MKKFDMFSEADLVAEIDTWVVSPSNDIINTFCWLFNMGYDIFCDEKHGLVARKDYLRISWYKVSGGPYVYVKRLPATSDGSIRWDKIKTDGHGIRNCTLIDIDQFRTNPPPNRDPRYVYNDGEKHAVGFVTVYSIKDGVTCRNNAALSAKVIGLYKIVGGSVISDDIENPIGGEKYRWFLIELAVYAKSSPSPSTAVAVGGGGGGGSGTWGGGIVSAVVGGGGGGGKTALGYSGGWGSNSKGQATAWIIYDKSKWARIDQSYRILTLPEIILSEDDKVLMDKEIERFSEEFWRGK